MEKKLYAIGEALIDFIPQESCRPMKDVLGFCPKVGGAPANVCGAFTRLGGKSEMIRSLEMILLVIKLKKHWKKTESEPVMYFVQKRQILHLPLWL